MKSIAVDFKDLWKIRHPVDNCEGFVLNSFDSLIEVMVLKKFEIVLHFSEKLFASISEKLFVTIFGL